MYEFSLNYVIKIIPILVKALKITLSMSIISLVLSLILSIVLALIIEYKPKIIYNIVKVYISFFRGTPVLAQLFLLYFGEVRHNITPFGK